MTAFDWLRINNKCGFWLANRFAESEFFKFFTVKDNWVRTDEFATIPILLPSKSLRTRRAICDTLTRSQKEPLDLSGGKICTQNLQIIMTGVYKCLSNVSPPITWDYFKHKISSYNLGNTQLLELSKYRLKTYGLNTALFKGALLWNNLPNYFWKAKSLIYLENKIQEWTGRSCNCCLLYLLLNCLLLKKCRYIK